GRRGPVPRRYLQPGRGCGVTTFAVVPARGPERRSWFSINPTISCINVRLVPQVLGHFGPIWYLASVTSTATHNRPQFALTGCGGGDISSHEPSDQLFRHQRQDQLRDQFRARLVLHGPAQRG